MSEKARKDLVVSKAPSPPCKISKSLRINTAMDLRAAGANWTQIADQLKISERAAYDLVKHALKVATDFDTFSILRPTSPFRLPETINRAFREWNEANRADEFTGTDGTGYQQERRYTSLRAVELADRLSLVLNVWQTQWSLWSPVCLGMVSLLALVEKIIC